MTQVLVLTAPPVESCRPAKKVPIPELQAPPWEINVPCTSHPAPMLSAPVGIPAPARKNTLQRRAPLVKIVFVAAVILQAPVNVKTNMASGLPPPSRITFPVKPPAVAIWYTPGRIVSLAKSATCDPVAGIAIRVL